MGFDQPGLGQGFERALGAGGVALDAAGQLIGGDALEFAQRGQCDQAVDGQLGTAAALLFDDEAAEVEVGGVGGQAHDDALAAGAAVVRGGAAVLEQAAEDLVHAATRAFHHADALHRISQPRVARAGFGGEQVGQRDAFDQPAGVADDQCVVFQSHMHGAQAVVIAVDEGVGHGLAEGAEVEHRHRYAEQADLQFVLRVVGAEVGFEPVQRLEQGEAPELVEAHRLLGHDLEGELMRGHEVAQRGFLADQQQAGEGGQALAVGCAGGEAEGAVHRLVVEFEQHAVAAELLHGLAQPLALQRVEVAQLRAGHGLGRGVGQAEAGGAAEALVRQHRGVFGGAVVLEAAAQVDAAAGGDLAVGLGHVDAGDLHAVEVHGAHGDGQRGRGAGGDQPAQAVEQEVVGVQSGGGAVVLHAQPQRAALGVGQADDGLDQLAVGQALAVALELDGEGFARGRLRGHAAALSSSGVTRTRPVRRSSMRPDF